jgi:hypothetical protein
LHCTVTVVPPNLQAEELNSYSWATGRHGRAFLCAKHKKAPDNTTPKAEQNRREEKRREEKTTYTGKKKEVPQPSGRIETMHRASRG